jgi:hypothetical protein
MTKFPLLSLTLLLLLFAGAEGFASTITSTSVRATSTTSSFTTATKSTNDPIISPFDTTAESNEGNEAISAASATTTEKLEGPLELTWENVEKVLDEMRPFLIQDGGNVAISEIDGPVVRLELQVSTSVCALTLLRYSVQNMWFFFY